MSAYEKHLLSNRRLGCLVLLLMLCGLLPGCGSGGSSDAPEVGKNVHPPNWRSIHGSEVGAQGVVEQVSSGLIACQVCHGEDFGGIGQALSCYACHVDGPPFRIHPVPLEATLPWRHPVNHGSAAKQDVGACQGCHGEAGGAGSNPRFNLAIGNLEAGCESAAGCHGNDNAPFGSFENGHNPGTAHPSLDPNDPAKQDLFHWYGERFLYADGNGQTQTYLISHYNAGNLFGACNLCHGANLQGGVGPACLDCHVVDPVTFAGNCVSCHGAPPVAVASFIAEVERAEPFDPVFLAAVQSGTHLQHDAVPCSRRQDQTGCRTCHVNTETGLDNDDLRTNVNRHHVFVGRPVPDPLPTGVHGTPSFGGTYGCFTCHPNLDRDSGSFSEPFQDCRFCHPDLFFTEPCPD